MSDLRTEARDPELRTRILAQQERVQGQVERIARDLAELRASHKEAQQRLALLENLIAAMEATQAEVFETRDEIEAALRESAGGLN
jgi:chromosome segregation ATPase